MAVVEEVYLEDFVAQAEHYCVTGFQPLLHVDEPFILVVDQLRLRQFGSFVIQLRNEPLKQHILLLEILIIGQAISGVADNIVLLGSRVIDIVDLFALQIRGHECLIIEVHAVLPVINQIAKPILLGVIDRSQHINFMLFLFLFLYGLLQIAFSGFLGQLAVEDIAGRMHAVDRNLATICVCI